ncbi:MAG TPA: hypothetical protein DEO60_01815 [Bacteroidales bacterium]|jgi:hypothetical protein|nr:hypothetical protein [Bacteroidales bacterium]HBZ19839.1 hypothetical protein [Bacteroidales bacterium]
MANSSNHGLRRSINKVDRLKRNNRLSLMLNNREARALGIYCSRYRVRNKSEFLRETIMKAILKRFDDDHPSLWEEPEPTLFCRDKS